MITLFGIISIAVGVFFVSIAQEDFDCRHYVHGLAQTLIGVAFILIGIGRLF